MLLKNLWLQNFRNYPKKDFTFVSGTTLVVGPNAVGKTNLLEAIYLLATGKSFRADLDEEMIVYGQDLARVGCILKNKQSLEITLTKGLILGKRVAKKIYKVNGVNRRMVDFVGNLRAVYFGPQDLEIIIDGPSIRRDYLDSVLNQADKEYRRAILSYKKGLRQRNRLLEQIRDEGVPANALYFWNKLLIENGQLISQKRREYLDFVNHRPDYFGKLNLDYDHSQISEERLAKYAREEIAAGMTLVGPHRDDFTIAIRDTGNVIRNLHSYGSRGEQRTAIFSLKLAELEFIASKSSASAEGFGETRPILLLDDIFSELDHQRRAHLLEIIPKQQTIITTADMHLVDPAYRQKVDIIKL